MIVRGLNHITLSVRDLDRSIAFYADRLGGRLTAQWDSGAYLDLGGLWLCLARTDHPAPAQDYSHIALTADPSDFDALADLPCWQENRSEGASLYILDPDGHKLELHQGDMATRLAHYRADPGKGVAVHD